MRYDFTVTNTSNVPLEDFYWHDRIPTDAAQATIFTTGTYSAQLNYRILYKTNYSTAYQVLASNLITTSNPTLTVTVSGTAANGYQLVNRADAGGKYQGTWQTAQATWVTVIRKLTPTPAPTLPKTGY